MKTSMRKHAVSLLFALALAVGIMVSTSAMAFASTTRTPTTQAHGARHAPAVSISCSYYRVPLGPYALASISDVNPSVVVYLEAIPYGAGNVTYYVWKSFNGFPGNPIQEGQQAPFTFVYDILLMGYVQNTPAVYICSDWTVVGFVRMY